MSEPDFQGNSPEGVLGRGEVRFVMGEETEEDTGWEGEEEEEGSNVEVDFTPLHNQLERNKESLKVKLMMRRPMNTLVEQGLMPEYKTSPSLHEQRTKLERAKMGDMLRAKIASRPERAELVHRHILEDVRPDVDPSLCEKQRQLKRAKLVDSLATQLSHRPGPLELIQKKILHTDDPLEQAVKEGTLQFRPTADGVPTKPVLFTFDEDSSSPAPSPQASLPSEFSAPAPPPPVLKSVRSESLGDITVGQSVAALRLQHDLKSFPHHLVRSGSFGGSGGDLATAPSTQQQPCPPLSYIPPTSTTNTSSLTPNASLTDLACLSASSLQREAPGKDKKKSKLKSKPLTAPKPRTIKFHEYKGPETSLKRKAEDNKSKEDTTYDLLLQQQQLFLQWQLENQNKFPQILLPAVGKVDSSGRTSIMSLGSVGTVSSTSGTSSSQASSSVPSPANSIPGTPRATTPRASTPIRALVQLTPQDVNHATSLLNKLEDMKVTDLKMELKKRNLHVSGPKPALVERLRPVLEAVIAAGRKQFQQPYKQISIPPGGLIILKPSPNSQLLTKPEPNCEVAPSPAPMHEGTPEMDQLAPSPLSPQYTGPHTPLSPGGMLSPSESVLSLSSNDNSNSQLEDILREASSPHNSLTNSNMELEFNLQFMESDEQGLFQPPPAPPPPPPPPPPKLSALSSSTAPDPKPLPAPPSSLPTKSSVSPFQFLPPQKTTQQIQLAKAQLEAQLGSASSGTNLGSGGVGGTGGLVRAGPKGQFIWPPVSLQSGQGTVTIRASRGQVTAPQVGGSTPVAELAAVFSSPQTPGVFSSQSPLQVQLPLEPIPPGELGMTFPPGYRGRKDQENNSVSNVQLSPAPNQDNLSIYQLPASQLPATLPSPQQKSSSMQQSAITGNQPHSSSLQPHPPNLLSNPPSLQPHTLNLQTHPPNNKPHPSSIQLNSTNLQTHPPSLQSDLQPPQSTNNQPVLNPSDVLSRTESIISQQQKQIELLQSALQRSQQQLLQQQNMLRGEQEGLQVKQQQSSNGMKLLLAQQLQNKQLAAQIHHLQESQHKVQEEQVAVMTAMSRQHPQSGTNGAGKSSLHQNGNTHLHLNGNTYPHQNGNGSLQQNGSMAVHMSSNGNSTVFQQEVANNNNSVIAPRLNPEQQESPVNCVVNQTQNTNLELLKKVNKKGGVSLPVSQTNSMDDVLEILMKNGDLSSKPPPPPPLPVVKTTSSMEMKTTPTSSMDCVFPQLDLADISFDFGQSAMPDLPPSIFGGSEVVEQQGNIFDKVKMVESQGITFDKVMSEGESMEVDQDVADWLDSLVVRPQTNGLPNSGTFGQSPGMILNGDPQMMCQNNLVEQGGNNWGKITNFTQ